MKAYNFRQGIVDGKTLQTARGEFIRRNLGSTHSWTLSEGVAAVRLDNVMRKLSQSIADELLSNLEAHVLKGQDTPIAQTELCRIQKSLYRMETFCFNDVALHNISWGHQEVRYASDYYNEHTEYLLSRGVQFIDQLLCTSDFEQRRTLMGGDNIRSCSAAFLFVALETYAESAIHVRRSALTEEKKAALLSRTAMLGDPDPAIERVWNWSHAGYFSDDKSQADLTMYETFRPLRACGYVFWDVDIIEQTGWLEQDFEDITLDVGEEIYDDVPSQMSEIRSWVIRSKLYTEGSRGYWGGNPDTTAIDESQQWRLKAITSREDI
ncbi:hypothetical protein CKAH01_13624 [Colletotrichum kahawae]|uniref:Uncharacterized protein n=1 Tax=Colletotrichum kahawae TaxID=34407 RepID=A0AAD9YQ76_COLKA|nr:hypothetical protein CKAH01_13624 [Colletotrichum kahawae]